MADPLGSLEPQCSAVELLSTMPPWGVWSAIHKQGLLCVGGCCDTRSSDQQEVNAVGHSPRLGRCLGQRCSPLLRSLCLGPSAWTPLLHLPAFWVAGEGACFLSACLSSLFLLFPPFFPLFPFCLFLFLFPFFTCIFFFSFLPSYIFGCSSYCQDIALRVEVAKRKCNLVDSQAVPARCWWVAWAVLPRLPVSVLQGLFQGVVRAQVQSHAGEEQADLPRREGRLWRPPRRRPVPAASCQPLLRAHTRTPGGLTSGDIPGRSRGPCWRCGAPSDVPSSAGALGVVWGAFVQLHGLAGP